MLPQSLSQSLAELAEAQDEIETLKTEMAAKMDEVISLKKNVEDSQLKLETLLTEKRSTVEDLEIQKSSILDKNAALEKDVETWRARVDSTSELNVQLEQQLVGLRKMLDESEAEVRHVNSHKSTLLAENVQKIQ